MFSLVNFSCSGFYERIDSFPLKNRMVKWLHCPPAKIKHTFRFLSCRKLHFVIAVCPALGQFLHWFGAKSLKG